MNVLSTSTRICVRQNLAFRPMPTRSLQLQQHTQTRPQQLRQLATTTQSNAQPIGLTSNTTPASPSEASTLSSSILSRASTVSNPTPSRTSSQDPSSTATNTAKPSAKSPFLRLGTVTRTGTMASTVQVTTQSQTFDRWLQKHYMRPSRLLAHDPNPTGFLREGDVVEYGLFSAEEQAAKEEKRLTLEKRLLEKGVIRLRTRRGKERKLKDVGVQRRGPRWVVRRVVGPFGVGVDERLT